VHIHILGICGAFMGGLAVIARQAGHKVTGCDANVYPPMSTQLRAQGIELIEGFDPRQIEMKPDLFVVGGGINGAGIACDAAGRALKVGLCEMNDFASATSSKATKLIHGGLRYLELYEFRLVREALMEREVLLAKAPHLSWPLRFVLPHEPHLRPRWMLRLGLFLYDHLDWHMTLPKSQAVDLRTSKWGAGLKPSIRAGLSLS